MIKELRYAGYTANTSDYDCPDGDLSLSFGLIKEDGYLRTLPNTGGMAIPKEDGVDLDAIYIHRSSSFVHLIVLEPKSRRLFYSDYDTRASEIGQPKPIGSIPADLVSVHSMGNTLMVITKTGMHYFLWKGTEHGYKHLGEKIPEMPIAFDIGFDLKSEGRGLDNYHDHQHIYSRAAPITNKLIADIYQSGKFVFPFLVRYALRLYDGSLTMQSAPVLLAPSDGMEMRVLEKYVLVTAFTGTLHYNLLKPHALDEWTDIVKSVEFFISPPIYTYDQERFENNIVESAGSGYEIQSFSFLNQETKLRTVAKVEVAEDDYQNCTHTDWRGNKSFGKTLYDSEKPSWRAISLLNQSGYDTARYDRWGKVLDNIRDSSTFYHLYTLDLSTPDNLDFSRRPVPISQGYLPSLTSHESLKDDYQSHDLIIPSSAFVYNSRLNITDIKRKILNEPGMLILSSHSENAIMPYGVEVQVRFIITDDNQNKRIILGHKFRSRHAHESLSYIYCPYPRCSTAVIIIYSGSGASYAEVKMNPHNFLSGSVFFRSLFYQHETRIVETSVIDELFPLSTPEELTYNIPNKIYTSEVNNPFHFPLSGINTIGTGRIIAISSATKALSEGQFGQFPLYAFSSDGVWALEVSPAGLYSARQPVSREVCLSPSSIAQTDTGVIFASRRGVMMLSGSTCVSISDSIHTEGEEIYRSPSEDYMRKIMKEVGFDNEVEAFSPRLMDILTEHCSIAYDHKHQRAFVYNSLMTTHGSKQKRAHPCMLVYSLRHNSWASDQNYILRSINAYPDTVIVRVDDKTIVRLSEDKSIRDRCCTIAVTRPIKLDNPSELKTIDTVIQRTDFDLTDIPMALFGSNNMVDWFVVSSASRGKYLRGFSGSPYKFFSLVFSIPINKDNKRYTPSRLSGASIQYSIKHPRRLR
nr:hypothetical protein [uncultured Porphyromonas sp.]